MILETLADKNTNQEEKDKVLAPYEAYIKSQSRQIKQQMEKRAYSAEGSVQSSQSAESDEPAAQVMQPKCSRGDFIVANQLEEELKKQLKFIKKRKHSKP